MKNLGGHARGAFKYGSMVSFEVNLLMSYGEAGWSDLQES